MIHYSYKLHLYQYDNHGNWIMRLGLGTSHWVKYKIGIWDYWRWVLGYLKKMQSMSNTATITAFFRVHSTFFRYPPTITYPKSEFCIFTIPIKKQIYRALLPTMFVTNFFLSCKLVFLTRLRCRRLRNHNGSLLVGHNGTSLGSHNGRSQGSHNGT